MRVFLAGNQKGRTRTRAGTGTDSGHNYSLQRWKLDSKSSNLFGCIVQWGWPLAKAERIYTGADSQCLQQ